MSQSPMKPYLCARGLKHAGSRKVLSLLKLSPLRFDVFFTHQTATYAFSIRYIMIYSPLWWLFYCTLLAVTSLAHPPPPSDLQPRQTSAPSSSLAAGTPGIFAKVVSPNGTDLSANFQILIFHEPGKDMPSNLTDRGLENRQPPAVRPINSCRNPTTRFLNSICDSWANRRTNLQR